MVPHLGAKTVGIVAGGTVAATFAAIESVDPTQIIVGAMALAGVAYADYNRTAQQRIDSAQRTREQDAADRRSEIETKQAEQKAQSDKAQWLIDQLQDEAGRLRTIETANAIRLVDLQNRLWESESRERTLSRYIGRVLTGVELLTAQLSRLGAEPVWAPDEPPAPGPKTGSG